MCSLNFALNSSAARWAFLTENALSFAVLACTNKALKRGAKAALKNCTSRYDKHVGYVIISCKPVFTQNHYAHIYSGRQTGRQECFTAGLDALREKGIQCGDDRLYSPEGFLSGFKGKYDVFLISMDRINRIKRREVRKISLSV